MAKVCFFDITDGGMNLYVFEKESGSCRLEHKEHIPVDLNSSFALQRPAFDITDIDDSFISLPVNLLNFRVLELPFSDKEKIRAVIPIELNSLILKGSDSIVFDAHILGSSDGKYKVLVSYVDRALLKKILGNFTELNIDPRVVTSIELASILGTSEDITQSLLNPPGVGDEDRINMAAKELTGFTINLRRGSMAYTRDTERTRKSFRITAVIVAMLLIAFFSDMALRIVTTKRDISAIRMEVRKTYMSIFPGEKRVASEIYHLKSHIKEMKQKEESLIGVSPLELLLSLSHLKMPVLAFSEITMDKEVIILKGESPSLSDVQQLKGRLGEFMTDVNISDTKPSQQGKTIFTITAKTTGTKNERQGM